MSAPSRRLILVLLEEPERVRSLVVVNSWAWGHGGDPKVLRGKARAGLFVVAPPGIIDGVVIPERTITIPRFNGQRVQVGTPDLISMQVAFAENRFATIISSFAMPDNRGPVLEIIGERGVIAVADEMDYWIGPLVGVGLQAPQDLSGVGAGETADPGRAGSQFRRHRR